MKSLFLFMLFSATVLCLFAQDITISFQPKDTGKPIDSIMVTNQSTGQKVKLLGNESLTLSKPTWIAFPQFGPDGGYLYPNPCSGEATLSFPTTINQEAEVNLIDVSGRLITRVRLTLSPGQHRFKVVFPAIGLYTISVLKNDEPFVIKAVCTKGQTTESILDYEGSESLKQFKNAALGKTLKYSPGDVLLYSAYSGKYNTIITDSPAEIKTYSVEFIECNDPDKRSYKVVKIGNLWWFAENLQTTKYKDDTDIPNVTSATAWSELSTGAYSWYNNDAADSRNLYGGYYNWAAVNSGKLCPAGWHVPDDTEWKTMEMALGMTQAQADGTGLRGTAAQGTKMKAATGLDLYGNVFNATGFSGLLGGYRLADGTFNFAVTAGYWWSASDASATNGWFRGLYNSAPSVGRGDLSKISGLNVRCVRLN